MFEPVENLFASKISEFIKVALQVGTKEEKLKDYRNNGAPRASSIQGPIPWAQATEIAFYKQQLSKAENELATLK